MCTYVSTYVSIMTNIPQEINNQKLSLDISVFSTFLNIHLLGILM